jgi:hypothetical protein
MKESGASQGQSASELISKRIAELGDWRGNTLGRMRKLSREADPDVVEQWKWMGTPIWSHDGEGLAIGLSATRGAPVLGRPMAHLLGALGEFTLPNSQIVVRIRVEKLFHVDGRPRESFMPCPIEGEGVLPVDGDHELGAAFDLAEKLARMKSDPSFQPRAYGCS